MVEHAKIVAPGPAIAPTIPISPGELDEQIRQTSELVDTFEEEPQLLDDPRHRDSLMRTLNSVDIQVLDIILQEIFGVMPPVNAIRGQLINMIIDNIRNPPTRTVVGTARYYRPTLGFLYNVVTNPEFANDPDTEPIVRQVFEQTPYQDLVGYMAQLMPEFIITPQMTPEQLTQLFLEKVRPPRA